VDDGDSSKTTVMKFNGINWTLVGLRGFSEGSTSYTTIAIGQDEEPYVAFTDDAVSSKLTVMKFNGIQWVYVGFEGFSSELAYPSCLSFNPYGVPFIAYTDVGYSQTVTIMKFNGTWLNVGSGPYGITSVECLAFGPSGIPYVSYSGLYGKANVIKYDSVFVGINEKQQSRLSLYPNPATDKITVELTGATLGGKLTIVNIEGQQVITRQITESKTQVDISGLPSGVYFVRVTNDRTVEVGKFVKN